MSSPKSTRKNRKGTTIVLLAVTLCIIPSAFAELGVDWEQVKPNDANGWSERNGHAAAILSDRIWVVGGWGDSSATVQDDVWYSSDGHTWTVATTAATGTARQLHACVAFDNKLWIIGGNDGASDLNDVWYSADGVTWTQATASAAWAPRHGHSAIVFGGEIWVMGGNLSETMTANDVWHSADGIAWTQATASASWAARWEHSAVVHDGKMWVMGGATGTDYSGRLNDVWSSSDGINWTQATASATWSARSQANSVVINGKMWLLGGAGTAGDGDDVWYSSDGITWTRTNSSAWPERARMASVLLTVRTLFF